MSTQFFIFRKKMQNENNYTERLTLIGVSRSDRDKRIFHFAIHPGFFCRLVYYSFEKPLIMVVDEHGNYMTMLGFLKYIEDMNRVVFNDKNLPMPETETL